MIGQCGPLVGVRLFPKEQGPYYVPGMAICAGFMLGVAVLALGLRFYLVRLNARAGAVGGEYEMVGVEDRDVGSALMGGGKARRMQDRGGAFRFML